MSHAFAAIAFTPSVKAAQQRDGSRAGYARNFETGTEVFNDRLGDAEVDFIAAQRSFTMATVSETAWPYLQHRGGPRGFLKVLDDRTLAFADFAGNRQLVSVGNAAGNDRVALILVDYANRVRLKVLGRLGITDWAPHDPLPSAPATDPDDQGQGLRLELPATHPRSHRRRGRAARARRARCPHRGARSPTRGAFPACAGLSRC